MKNVAFVVDDVALNREIISDMLEEEYSIVEAANGREAIDILKARGGNFSVMLLDLMMPEVDGFGVLEFMQETKLSETIPVLIISSEAAPELEERCLSLGVSDFIKKPFNPALVRHRVRNAEMNYSYKKNLEDKVAEQTDELRKQNLKLRQMNEDTIELLSNVVEARSLESGQHVHRVKGFTRLLAQEVMIDYPEYGLTAAIIDTIVTASCMHDVGKIMISDAVLNKPGKLTPEEFEYMKTHTLLGCEVLQKTSGLLEKKHFDMSMVICRSHHEKWDGKGYPDGLKGEEIPIAAQLVSIADCYDALTTERVYKKAYSTDVAFDMIYNGQCGMFNPKLMRCFVECKECFAVFAEQSAKWSVQADEN